MNATIKRLCRADLSVEANRFVLADALEEMGDERADQVRAGDVPVSLDPREYYEECRDFANVYNVYVVRRSWAHRLIAVKPVDCKKLTSRRAWYRGHTRPAEAARAGEQWFGGFYDDRLGDKPSGREGILSACEVCTLRGIEHEECMREAVREYDERAAANMESQERHWRERGEM